MNGPRGSLVIGLLFLIAGQLGFIAAALTGQPLHGLVGFVMTVFFVLAVVRVLVELFREGRAEAAAEARAERAARDRIPIAVRRQQEARRAEVPDLDPQKRRPPHS
ncbi:MULTISPECIES: hypothetical protein [Brachybacterium]|uniref:Uncharacterized protein n=2 Tax=Brachybacterium TaxID=43668 RepID=A0A426SJ89_9MICO|nr:MULTISPECIES: hypothetical protein [Brachybacterium]RRR18247.1 hypothetical protein DS079_10900 [Brachybacterium paraconglomeratum]GLI30353.1 hypothetical protein BCONGLO52_11940 [Brachybacterium conglomeratum]GLK04891.1 hypothetical protein GCM10017597_16910 [Brachybacterium conglomeratum]